MSSMSQLPKSRRLLFIKVVDLDRNEIVTIRRPASSTRFESRDQLCDRVCDPTKDLTCRPTSVDHMPTTNDSFEGTLTALVTMVVKTKDDAKSVNS